MSNCDWTKSIIQIIESSQTHLVFWWVKMISLMNDHSNLRNVLGWCVDFSDYCNHFFFSFIFFFFVLFRAKSGLSLSLSTQKEIISSTVIVIITLIMIMIFYFFSRLILILFRCFIFFLFSRMFQRLFIPPSSPSLCLCLLLLAALLVPSTHGTNSLDQAFFEDIANGLTNDNPSLLGGWDGASDVCTSVLVSSNWLTCDDSGDITDGLRITSM